MGFSPLAAMARRIPDIYSTADRTRPRSSPRNSKITGFTIHHHSGVDAMGEATRPGREVSANYWIANDGTIIPHVDELRRAWTTGHPNYPAGAASDHRNITVEVSNSPEGIRTGTYAISDAAMRSLIALIGDVFKRHNLGPVRRGLQAGVAVHRDFVATECPGPYIMGRLDTIITEAEKARTGGQKESWFAMATKKDLEDAVRSVLNTHNISISGATARALGVDKRSAFSLMRYAAAALFEGREWHADLTAQVVALSAAMEALAGAQGVDPRKVEEIIQTAVDAALADLKITLTVEGDHDD